MIQRFLSIVFFITFLVSLPLFSSEAMQWADSFYSIGDSFTAGVVKFDFALLSFSCFWAIAYWVSNSFNLGCHEKS